MTGIFVRLRRTGRGRDGETFASPGDVGVPGRWSLLALRLPSSPKRYVAVAEFETDGSEAGDPPIVLERGASPYPLRFSVVAPLPRPNRLTLSFRDHGLRSDSLTAAILPIPRPLAALFCILARPWRFLEEVRREMRGGRAAFSLRAVMQRLIRARPRGIDYAVWLRLYGSRPDDAPPPPPDAPSISLLLFAEDPAGELCRRSRRAAEEQVGAASVRVARAGAPEEARAFLRECGSSYVGLLQAGEILRPGAIPRIRRFLAERGRPDIVYADEDSVDRAGRRFAPLFKPEPSLPLMQSGTLSRGVWAIRRSLLLACGDDALGWAETARLDSWLRAYDAGRAGRTFRLAEMLTSRREEAETAPAAPMAAIVSRHLERSGLAGDVAAGYPIRVSRRSAKANPGRVSIIIPSTLGSRSVVGCIASVLETTRYADLEIIVVAAQPDPPSPAQQAHLAALNLIHPVRLVWERMSRFNYATANNVAATYATGGFLCLLNDDVKPLDGDWLAAMVAFFDEAAVGIVGAKLYYPTMRIQHGGVIAGMGGLAMHVHSLLGAEDPGYGGRARLAQDLSAVTGACMLVRADLFDRLGGLDALFPSAYNDIDFCFRAREAGHRIVYAAAAELIHFESHTYGQDHYTYAGAESGQEKADRRRMIERWSGLLANDPFYNPNLSLAIGSEWDLACPPRHFPLSLPAIMVNKSL